MVSTSSSDSGEVDKGPHCQNIILSRQYTHTRSYALSYTCTYKRTHAHTHAHTHTVGIGCGYFCLNPSEHSQRVMPVQNVPADELCSSMTLSLSSHSIPRSFFLSVMHFFFTLIWPCWRRALRKTVRHLLHNIWTIAHSDIVPSVSPGTHVSYARCTAGFSFYTRKPGLLLSAHSSHTVSQRGLSYRNEIPENTQHYTHTHEMAYRHNCRFIHMTEAGSIVKHRTFVWLSHQTTSPVSS
jgi:hypothetical protein